MANRKNDFKKPDPSQSGTSENSELALKVKKAIKSINE